MEDNLIEEPTLRTRIVAAIMSLMKPPRQLGKVSIGELERILNSETDASLTINPDGTVGEQQITSTTVGAVADAVVALLDAERAALSKAQP